MTAALHLAAVDYAIHGVPILRGLNLEANHGAFLAVIGPNGSGKSTALQMMAGLLRPQQGHVLLEGQHISGLSRRAIARKVAVLTQGAPVPPGLLLRDLVGMGRYAHQGLLARSSAEDEAAISDAMERMDIAGLASRRLGELSGGQVQRGRMAMILAQDAPIVLLDEPTTWLDLRHQYGLLDMARSLTRQGRCVVAVLHDLMQAALYADRVAVIEAGQTIAAGAPEDVLTEALVSRVFGVATTAIRAEGTVLHIPKRTH